MTPIPPRYVNANEMAMFGSRATIGIVLLTAGCGLLDPQGDDGALEFEGTIRKSRGGPTSGGRSGAETGGASPESEHGSGGLLESPAGGSPSSGSAGEASAGGSPGSSPCGCDRGGRGSTVTCAAFADSVGEDAALWTCDSPPHPGFVQAGCEGFGSGIFRMCCPKSVTSEDFCPTR